jgi:alcohol dehydrogenase, propanol-preferring
MRERPERTMKAMVLAGPRRPLELRVVPVPRVGPNDALVQVKACGVGLTVVKNVASTKLADYPRIPGHEIAGVVVELGSAASGVAVGQRVTCHFYLTCGRCEFCRDGRESLCTARGGNIGRAIDGGYAEYVSLPVRNLVAIPDGVRDVDAAIACDAIATPLHACREARVRAGDDVLVIGAGGGVGIHLVQMARLHGGRVLAADLTDAKLALAASVGAELVVDARAGDLAEQALGLTGGRGVDAVIDLVGSDETLEAGLRALAVGGRWVLVGSPPRTERDAGPRIVIDPSAFQARALELHSSRYVNAAEIMRALELVRRGRITAVVTRTFPLERAEEAHELIRRNDAAGRLALVIA